MLVEPIASKLLRSFLLRLKILLALSQKQALAASRAAGRDIKAIKDYFKNV